MKDVFSKLVDQSSEAVLNATPYTQASIKQVCEIWDQTMCNMQQVEQKLVEQYIDGYDVMGKTPLNDMLQENTGKLDNLILLKIGIFVSDDDVYDFPQNFINSIHSDVLLDDDSLSPVMVQHIRDYHDAPFNEKSYTIEAGVSVVGEQLAHLTLKDFSRRLSAHYEPKSLLSIVPQ